MNVVHSFFVKLGTVGELMTFLWRERLWWMIPFVLTIVVIAGMMIFLQATPVAPFLYTIF